MRILDALLLISAALHRVHCYDPFDFIVDALNYTRIAGVTTCEIQLLRVIDEFKNGSMWAAKMIDANAKLQPGLLEGNILEMGSFDECLNVYDPDHAISGKYCLSRISAPRSRMMIDKMADRFVEGEERLRETAHRVAHNHKLSLYYGICIPDGCTPAEINTFLFHTLNESEVTCQTLRGMPAISNFDLNTIAIFVTIVLLLLAATCYDLYHYYTEEKPAHKIILNFSYWTNGRKLFSTSKNSEQLKFIHGIRSLSIIWVMWGHMYLMLYSAPNTNMIDVVNFFRSTISEVVSNAILAVETFFFLSGMFVAYMYLVYKHKDQPISWPMFYIHRYLRLTPVLASLVLLESSLIVQVGSGPFWPLLTTTIVSTCSQYWWSILLYVQNFVGRFHEMCMSTSWYLAVDMQLYCLSPIILLPLWKHPKLTLCFVSLLAFGSSAITFYVFWMYKLSDNLEAILTNDSNLMTKYYAKTYTRATPWFLGFIFGYFIFKAKYLKEQVKLDKILVAVLWLVAMILLLGSLFVPTFFRELPYSKPVHSCLHTFDKLFWSMGIGIVIYLCSVGYGGIVTQFLSLPVFEIVSKLSYCIYLLHNEVFILMRVARRAPMYFSVLNICYEFWAHFMVICFLATVWCLTFESPIVNLQSYYRKKEAEAQKPVEKRRSTISSVLEHDYRTRETMPAKTSTPRESAHL